MNGFGWQMISLTEEKTLRISKFLIPTDMLGAQSTSFSAKGNDFLFLVLSSVIQTCISFHLKSATWAKKVGFVCCSEKIYLMNIEEIQIGRIYQSEFKFSKNSNFLEKWTTEKRGSWTVKTPRALKNVWVIVRTCNFPPLSLSFLPICFAFIAFHSAMRTLFWRKDFFEAWKHYRGW